MQIHFILVLLIFLSGQISCLENEKEITLFSNQKEGALLKESDKSEKNFPIDIRALITELFAKILDMKKDENGIYHAIFNCWQRHFGYMPLYDIVFNLVTDMKLSKEIFTFEYENYILWAWKGDYLLLGAGAELGIYYGGKTENSFWKINKSLAMPMTLTLTHKKYGVIVDNWNSWGDKAWWITAFNPRYRKVKADDLIAKFTVKFDNEPMFNKFAKIERKGWTYDNINKIGCLIL